MRADDLTVGNIVFKNAVVFNGSWCFTAAKGNETDLVEIYWFGRKNKFYCF